MIARSIIAFLVAATISVTAADAAQHQRRARHPRPQPPPPPAEIARLSAMHGTWNFDGTVTMGRSRPRKVRWKLVCKTSAGGWALACEETMRLPRLPVMRGHDLFGYDAATGTVHFYTVNSFGETHDALGKWTDENTIHYRYEGTQGGKPMVQEADVVLHGPDAFDVDLKVTVGGDVQSVFHGTFHKAPPRPRRARRAAAPPAPTEAAPAAPAQ